MVKTNTTTVSRDQALSYLRKAQGFLDQAQVAKRDGSWNSAGLLAIHAGISAADALLGYTQNLRSTSADHKNLVRLMMDKIPGDKREEWKKQKDRLAQIIGKKNVVEYESREITEKEAVFLVELAGRFFDWVKTNLPKP